MRRRRGSALLVAGVLAVGGCAGDGDVEPTASPTTDGSSAVIATTTTTPPTTTGAPVQTTAPPGSSEPATSEPATTEPATTPPPTTAPPTTIVVGDPGVGAEVVADFDEPVDLAVRDGDDALYVVEQGGRVVRFADGEGTDVADVGDRIDASGNEQGLLGLEFSPDGTLAYLDFTDLDGNTVVAEYPVGADGMLDTDAERLVIRIDQPYGNHNAGDLAFGPDGFLYVTLGDGGSGGDPERRASDPTQLLGSLLRIDPTPSADAGYTIPDDNPFTGGSFEGRDGAPEVWAWGLRNPWKIAFDPVTGELWIPDVGQNEVEEINVAAPSDGEPAGRGDDFGWSAFEGNDRFNADVPALDTMIPPVLTYRHGTDGCSITGGVPYRGDAIPELAPAFVYSDFCSGILWALDLAGGRNLTLMTGFQSVSAVRAGPDGELYVLERSGTVYRIVPG